MPSNCPVAFLKIDNNIIELEECSFSNEEILQETTESCIEILEKVFGTSFASCGRIRLPNGLETDLVLIDINDNIPVILELKISKNPEVRRHVLGQLLEYMTSVYMYPDEFIAKCREANVDVNERIILENIQNKRIRGVIVGDLIPDIVKRTIEVLNSESKNMQFFAVEFQRLCNKEENISMIVPVLIGEVPGISGKTKKLWRLDELREAYEQVDNPKLRERLQKLLTWAKEKGLFVESRALYPTFRIGGNITVYLDGKMDIGFGRNIGLPKEKRALLLSEFQKLDLLPANIQDPDSVPYSKRITKSIAEISEETFDKMLKTIESVFLKDNN